MLENFELININFSFSCDLLIGRLKFIELQINVIIKIIILLKNAVIHSNNGSLKQINPSPTKNSIYTV